jgi:cell division septum initiation protein DivIVA
VNVITINKILETIKDIIKSQPKVPMTGIILIDGGRLLDLIEKLRSTLPEEIRQSKWVAKEKQEILAKAHDKAKKIVANAQNRANLMLSDEHITRDAEIQIREMIKRANEEEVNIIRSADAYSDELLSYLEDELNKFTIVIQKTRDKAKQSSVNNEISKKQIPPKENEKKSK